jgi:ribosomal protein S18 acetylase RimI-like enzyme
MPTVQRIVLDEDPRDYLDWRGGSGGTVEIFDIVIGSERGVGKGRRLVDLLRQTVSAGNPKLIYAITRDSNSIAKEFYRHLGFRNIAVLHRFYPDTYENGVMFGLDI